MAPKSKSHSAKLVSASKAKSTSSAKRMGSKTAGQYFIITCDFHLQHLKNLAVSLRIKENSKKIKHELLKDRKQGKYFVTIRTIHLLHSKM